MSQSNWVDISSIKSERTGYLEEKFIHNNIRENIRLIKYWLKEVEVHDRNAILVSGGPSIDFDKIKKRLKKYPNSVIFCVKHALPKLLKHNIIPDFCLILDIRTIYESSSWDKKRYDLISNIPEKTKAIILTRASPEYTKYIQKQNRTVIGLNFKTETLLALNLEESKIPEELNEILKFDCSFFNNISCAADTLIVISYYLGFRKYDFFGYDGSVHYDKNLEKKIMTEPNNYHRIKTNSDKIYYTTGEMLALVESMDIFFIKLNTSLKSIKINFYGGNNAITALYKDTKQKFTKMKNQTKSFLNLLKEINKNLSITIPDHFLNQAYIDSNIKTQSFLSYKDYIKNDNVYLCKNPDILYSNGQSLKHISSIILKLNRKRNYDAKYGICHGIGNFSSELSIFEKELNLTMTGTDLDIIKNPNFKSNKYVSKNIDIIQFDFHHVKSTWFNHFDIIYSNSYDNSYDIEYLLKQWKNCLSYNGVLILEHSIIQDIQSQKCFDSICKISLDKLKIILTNCNLEIIYIEKVYTEFPKFLKSESIINTLTQFERIFLFIQKKRNCMILF